MEEVDEAEVASLRFPRGAPYPRIRVGVGRVRACSLSRRADPTRTCPRQHPRESTFARYVLSWDRGGVPLSYTRWKGST